MKTKFIFCLSFILLIFKSYAQEFNWATSVTGGSYEFGTKSTKDSQGNTYFIGYATNTSFEYEGNSYSTNGRGDVFLGKLDSSKNLVWLKQMGGDDSVYYEESLDIHLDPFDNLYITLKSAGNNFTYDGQILSGIDSQGQYGGEGVLLKINTNGNYLWHDSGETSSSFQGVTTDSNGNVYLIGYFRSSITLGGAITLTNPSTGTTMDMLVAKYQPDGTILWAKNAGGTPHNSFAYGYDIEINPQTNDVIVLGTGDGDIFYDGVPLPTTDNVDEAIVLISYTMDGNQNWIQEILIQENNWYKTATSIDINESGIIGATGYKNSENGYVGFYTSDGTIISEHSYPSSQGLRIYSIALNEFNEAYITGWSYSDAILGMSPGTVSLSESTGFIAKIDLFQQVQWVNEFEASGFTNNVNYKNGSVLYAGRMDDNFIYNENQDVITNNSGDAVFGELIDYALPSNRSNITGTVFQDLDDNCIMDNDDIVQSSIIVKATDDNGTSHYAVTDLNGNYDIPVYTGTYTVEILTNPILETLISQNCYTEQQVTITQIGEDANNLDFPIELADCPLLSVDINSDRRRRCFQSNTYVYYSNLGFAQAQNAEVIVKFPEYVTFVSSDHSYTIDAQGNYVFDVGTLEPNESGTIHIIDSTDCIDGITGQTQCTEAWITPANNCVDDLDSNNEDWDQSTVKLDGLCVNNTIVQFTITNVAFNGIGDMENPQEYRIYLDNVLTVTSTFQLNGEESVQIDYPANGQTIRFEVDQHPMHPGNSTPQVTIEACGQNSANYSAGYVNTMPMDDLDPDVEVHCLEIIDSYDPNDKMVSPTGVTVNHYLEAGTTLDYMIRFQNTGSDTAYKVVITDELSEHLDPSTIQWGSSSHPYTINISGTNRPILEFTFNDINLPHSSVDELGSNGFVKFKVATSEALPIGTEINNDANIYFDFNLPILTNTVQTVIQEFDNLSVETHYIIDEPVLYPNPTSGYVFIKTDNIKQVEVYTISGILLKTVAKNEVDLSELSKGMYLVKIISTEGINLKKIILK